MNKDIIKNIQKDLVKSADEKTKISFQRHFKEKIKYYGIKTNLVRKIAKDYFEKIKDKPKKEIFSLCEELFKSGFCEEASIAGEWTHFLCKEYQKSDFKVFENWIDKYIDNWTECDNFCNHTMGDFIDQYPEFIKELKQWTKSKNRWIRRASAVSLILPARKGKFLNEIFNIADSLLLDQDDLVQKGYGWMLKEASHKHQQAVFDYVVKNKKVMPRTALRYAIEKMPQNLRKIAMEK